MIKINKIQQKNSHLTKYYSVYLTIALVKILKTSMQLSFQAYQAGYAASTKSR
jgi:hypothetical protein